MWIKIVPNDTLFFRSGRPFSMGLESWADLVFPPNPSTVYGAVRTFLVFDRGTLKDFRQKGYDDIGTLDKKGKMKVIGPIFFNFKHNISYFPCPLDLVKEKGDGNENNEVFLLNKLSSPKIFYTDNKLDEILIYKGEKQVEEVENYLDGISFKEYLQKNRVVYSVLKNKFYKTELKIGIARQRQTLLSKERHLYRIPMVRLEKGISFLVKIEEVNNMPDKGVFQFGAEGKTISFEKIGDEILENLRNIENIDITLNGDMFKVYLATPAIFNNGWLPSWLDKNSMEGEKDGVKVKLIACAIGKFTRVGGWDMAKNEPKQMYKTVPAGSVYYFKITNNASLENVKKVFHFKNISDINPEEGFGLSFIGRCER